MVPWLRMAISQLDLFQLPTDGGLGNCTTSVTVPVLQTAVNALRNNLTSIDRVLNDGFEVHWITDDAACTECAGSGGRCGYNSSYFKPICFCPDKAYLMRCQLPPGKIIEVHIIHSLSVKQIKQKSLLTQPIR